MKEIKFYELSLTRNPMQAVLLFCVYGFPAASLFGAFDFLGEFNVKVISAGCILLMAFNLFFRQFFYPNHVQWNKRGINIRVNDFWGKNISFKGIREITYGEKEFTVVTAVGDKKTINLEGIDFESKAKLLDIMREHAR